MRDIEKTKEQVVEEIAAMLPRMTELDNRFAEFLKHRKLGFDILIYATDISQQALSKTGEVAVFFVELPQPAEKTG